MVKPETRRQAVLHLQQAHGVSERRACRTLRQHRSSQRYKRKARITDEALKAEILAVTKAHHRAGYRMVTDRLQRSGLQVSERRVRDLYRAMGLSLRVRGRKRLKVTARYPRTVAERPGDVWCMDFVSESLCDGRRVRIFAAQDQASHRSLVLRAGVSMTSLDVVRLLDEAAQSRGYPRAITCDNGPEFRSRIFGEWAAKHGIDIQFIQPGKPTQNAFAESFNGRLRDECLGTHWFTSLAQLRSVLREWQHDYNCERPQRALKKMTPNEAWLTLSKAA